MTNRQRQTTRMVIIGVILLVSLLSAQVSVYAQSEPTQDDVNAVARKLFCPVCENTPLDVCPTEACQQWRDVIRTKLMEGQSEQQILDYFAEMYGDSVLAQPPRRQLVAWLLPVVIVLAAIAVLAYWVRSWMKPVAAAADAAAQDAVSEPNDPYVERLEQELSEWQ